MTEASAKRKFNKPCEIEDWSDPEFRALMRDIFSNQVAQKADWPDGVQMRKEWECTMAVLAFKHVGLLRSDSLILGVGAGLEQTSFYLTNHVGWVFATDLYAAPAEWQHTAPGDMLRDPGRQARIPFNSRRLVTQHMDGLDLRYEDETFDGIFSSSSIEHFGEWEDVVQAAREMGRVLKPGGLVTIATEFRISGDGHGVPNILMFSIDEFRKLIIEPSGLEPVDELQTTISARTLAKKVSQKEMETNVKKVLAGGQADWSTYPHIILDAYGYSWTSYHLALRKPLR